MFEFEIIVARDIFSLKNRYGKTQVQVLFSLGVGGKGQKNWND